MIFSDYEAQILTRKPLSGTTLRSGRSDWFLAILGLSLYLLLTILYQHIISSTSSCITNYNSFSPHIYYTSNIVLSRFELFKIFQFLCAVSGGTCFRPIRIPGKVAPTDGVGAKTYWIFFTSNLPCLGIITITARIQDFPEICWSPRGSRCPTICWKFDYFS